MRLATMHQHSRRARRSHRRSAHGWVPDECHVQSHSEDMQGKGKGHGDGCHSDKNQSRACTAQKSDHDCEWRSRTNQPMRNRVNTRTNEFAPPVRQQCKAPCARPSQQLQGRELHTPEGGAVGHSGGPQTGASCHSCLTSGFVRCGRTHGKEVTTFRVVSSRVRHRLYQPEQRGHPGRDGHRGVHGD